MASSATLGRLRMLGTSGLMVVLTLAALVWSISISRRSVAFAFFINWGLMGLAFVAWTIVPMRLGRGYYRVHRIERSGQLYEAVGVRLFQRVLRVSGLGNPSVFPGRIRRPAGAASLVAATCNPETAHLLIFIVVTGLAVDAALRGWWDTAGWLLLFNVLMNAYPVISLRHVRARAERVFGADK